MKNKGFIFIKLKDAHTLNALKRGVFVKSVRLYKKPFIKGAEIKKPFFAFPRQEPVILLSEHKNNEPGDKYGKKL